MGLLDFFTKKQPVIAASLVAGAIDLAGYLGFHLGARAMTIVGAVSALLLATVAHRAVGSPNTMADLIEQIDRKLGIVVNVANGPTAPAPLTPAPPLIPSPTGDAAVGGALGGAAGGAVGGAVGGALGSVLGAVTGVFDHLLSRKKGTKP